MTREKKIRDTSLFWRAGIIQNYPWGVGVRLEKLKYDVIHKKVGPHKITQSAESIAHSVKIKTGGTLMKIDAFLSLIWEQSITRRSRNWRGGCYEGEK